MCIDYRQLNSRTRKNKYPLPQISNLLEQLSGARIFTKMDLRGAYHLLRIAAGHESKTTFRCRYGAFEFLVMPFGLTNAPSTFQHFINDVFHKHIDKFVIVYLDDILVYSRNLDDHRKHVLQVLKLLRDFNLFAKASKCTFHQPSVEYLGYIVGASGISMDESKVTSILEWPKPTSVKGVQSFLGFANFYRRFIRDYSKIVTPMTSLTKKDLPFDWNPKCDEAFEALKIRFTSAPILAHFDPSLATVVETDASDYAMGAIISQIGKENILHPVVFDSRKLSPAELNYEIHDKELLAIIWCFQKWRSLLLSQNQPISVLSDHKALEYFMSSKVLTRRQARWAEILAEYDFTITYRPGKQGQKPDSLSRRDDVYPSGGDGAYAKNNPQNFRTLLPQSILARVRLRQQSDVTDPTELSPENRDTIIDIVSEILKAQQTDESLLEILNEPSSDKLPYKIREDGLVLIHDKIYVPDDPGIHLLILKRKHDHVLAGHPGITKTYQLIKRSYYWPKAKPIVTDYVSSCLTCVRNKSRRQRPYGPLQPLQIANRPWTSISMDFIEELPGSSSNNSILVVVDRFTKMARFIPTVITATSKDLAILMVKHIFTKHGIPDSIISDRGAKFVSKFWQRVCSSLGIDRKLSTAYHPETDGQTERINSVLEQYLRIYVNYQQDDWSEWLPFAEFAYNNGDHSSTGTSPFFANYGFHPTFEISDGVGDSRPGKHFVEDLSALHAKIKESLQGAVETQKRFADKKRGPSLLLQPGDTVMLSTRNIRVTRPTRKFSERYVGPFEILEQISDTSYRLKLPQELSRIHPVFHVSLLLPTKKSDIPGRHIEPPGPLALENEDVYEVEAIVDCRYDKRRKRYEYKVEWKGYQDRPDRYTWEPAENLIDAVDELDEFHDRYPNKPRPRR